MEVIQRAEYAYPLCVYVWGGGCLYASRRSDGYYPADCSGYCSWCWGVGYHATSQAYSPYGAFSSKVTRKASSTGQYETDFPGIQPGDVLGDGHYYTKENGERAWTGHVAMYMGNNTIYEYYTSDWDSSPTGRGCRITGYRTRFKWYASYDNTSASYDPDDVDPETGRIPDEHAPTPIPDRVGIVDSSNDMYPIMALILQYTPRRIGMKPFRPVKG